MLAKILAWFLILSGIFFLIKPEILRKRLQKKITKRLKRYLSLLAIFLGILFISAAWKSQGCLAKLLLVLGIIAIFKGLFFMKAKASEKVMEWFAARGLTLFRLMASVNIVIGIIILLS